jgi:hypothetical protein
MGFINIAYRCVLRPNGSWAPGSELTFIEGGQIRILPRLPAADSNLAFTTKEEAEAVSDATAREWCAKNYPGLPRAGGVVTPVWTEKARRRGRGRRALKQKPSVWQATLDGRSF